MAKIRRRAFILGAASATVLTAMPRKARAATVFAASGSATDLQSAVDKAQTGDTVVIPAGTFDFTGQVHAPDGIHIMGAGRDKTFLIKKDDLSEWHAMITVDCKTGHPFVFSGITLQGRLDVLQGTNRTTAATKVKDQGLVILGAAKNVMIFGCRFSKFVRAGIEFVGSWGRIPGPQTGVVYNNQFIDNWYSYLGYGVAVNGNPTTWNAPLGLGAANAIFVEDNYFERQRHCVTGSNGAIYTARYNTVKDNYQDSQSFDAHGLSRAWSRGTRAVEIYKNTVDNSIRRWAGVGIRGGAGVVWGNRLNGVTHAVVLYLEIPPSREPLRRNPALDQIGNPDGLYIWDNDASENHVYMNPTKTASTPYPITYWIQQGRDYYLQAKSGYAPYTYPHPLRALHHG